MNLVDEEWVLVRGRHVPVPPDGFDALRKWAGGWEGHFRSSDIENSSRNTLVWGNAPLDTTREDSVFNSFLSYAMSLAAYREIGWVGVEEYSAVEMKMVLRGLTKKGIVVLTNRFIGPGKMKGKRMDFLCDILLPQVLLSLERGLGDWTDLKIAVDDLRKADGCGAYLAWNSVLDSALYSPSLNMEIPDDYVVVSSQAGAGLRIMGRLARMGECLSLRDEIREDGGDLKAYDVEHMLRRFQRDYVKRAMDEGRTRARYG